MDSCSQQFRDYLFQILCEVKPKNDKDERDFPLMINDELESVSPHEGNPFAFFTFFFERKGEAVNLLSLPNGQKLFIAFFEQLPKSYLRPYEPLVYNFSDDKLTLKISHFLNPEHSDYSTVTTTLNFEDLLVQLLQEELLSSERVLKKFLRTRSVNEQRNILIAIREDIQLLNRINLTGPYDDVLRKLLETFKNHANKLVWALTPAVPLTEVSNQIAEIEHTDNTRIEILKNMCDKFRLSGRNVIRNKSDFQEVVELFINQNYNSKIFLTCNALEVGYILRKMFDYGFEINISACGREGCINNWVEKTETYKPMTELHLRQVTKETIYPKKTYAEIDKFFSSIKLSNN